VPSPVGHALAGAAAGLALARVRPATTPLHQSSPAPWSSPRHVRRELLRIALVYGTIAILPDLDLLAGIHSAQTHSVGAAAIAGAIAATLVPGDRLRVGFATAAAYATHILLDWLGNDGTPPLGVMALWPFTDRYYESTLHIFMAISRHYWLPGFLAHNLYAITREVAILAPIAIVLCWIRARAAAQRS
jgi:membrane-bound metal-dependent hydrolase YbcI (DUF457 family)